MKKMIVLTCALVLCWTVPVFAGAFDVQDTEAKQIAAMVKDFLGDNFIQEVMKQYPDATLNWEARLFPTDNVGEIGTWVVYCEVGQKDKEPVYYYWEVKITNVTAAPSLAEKYGIPLN